MTPVSHHAPLALDGDHPPSGACGSELSVLLREGGIGLLRQVDAQRLGAALHARGGVDGVPEETIPRVQVAYDRTQDGARVYPDANFEAPLPGVLRVEGHNGDGGHDLLRELQDLCRVVLLRRFQVPDAEVRVTDGFDLKEAVLGRQGVHCRKEPVHHGHDLLGRQTRRELGIAHNVGEKNGHALKVFRLHPLPRLQLLRHARGHHAVEQVLVLVLRSRFLHLLGQNGFQARGNRLKGRPVVRVGLPTLFDEAHQRVRAVPSGPLHRSDVRALPRGVRLFYGGGAVLDDFAHARQKVCDVVSALIGFHRGRVCTTRADAVLEGPLSRHDLPDRDGEGVHVRSFRLVGRVVQALGGHVFRSAPEGHCAQLPRKPEVAYLAVVVVIHEDVRGLDVAVHKVG